MTTRERLTKFEYAVIFLRQMGKCGCGCGQKLQEGRVDEEHTIPNYFKPGKPDALWLRECHKEKKTPKDREDIAKCERRQGNTGQQARRKRKGPTFKSRNDLGGDNYKRAKAIKARIEAERRE